MATYVGMDLGTSTIKICCGSKKILIPSIIGEPNPGWTGMSLDKTLEHNLVLTEGNNEWYVGELARLQSEVRLALASEGQMKSAEDTFIAVKAALSLLMEGPEQEFVVATGVPVATGVEVMKNLSRMMKGELKISVKNDSTNDKFNFRAKVLKTLVMPEPYGTYYKILKDKGEETAVDAVIVDIGHGSTDILTMYQGRPMRTASGSLIEATDTLTSRMAKALQDKTGAIIKPFDLMTTIMKGKTQVMIGGQYYEITELKNHYAIQIAKIIIDEVMRLIATLPPDAFIEYYIVTGGGAHTFGEQIRSEIIARKLVAEGDKAVIPEDPVLSNAEGFELIAQSQI
ncbi:MAG: ParM/StbA family protein [Candidatus Helarchaeota archaeon]|nr:ParM/StbA family protein [Candidatus Helarchaeota archaeon]